MPQINPPAQSGGGIVFATPADLISKALKIAGVVGFGMPATAAELADGLQTLNLMLDQWGVLRENVNVRKSESFPLVIGQNVYAIGNLSTDFDTVRPIRIEQAYIRDINGTDLPPLNCYMQEEEYSGIAIKKLSGVPTNLFYKADYPFGIITLDSAPSLQYTLFMNSWKPFAQITDAADLAQISYPDGYHAAMTYNLAKLLCAENKKAVPPTVDEMAYMSLQGLQSAYGEMKKVTDWDAPNAVRRIKGSFYNMGLGE